MPLYRASRSRTARILLIWLLAELLAAVQVRKDHEFLLVSWLRTLASPVVATARLTARAAGDLAWGIRDFRTLATDNERLRRQLAGTRARIHLLQEEAAQYRHALHIAASFPRLDAASSVATCIHRSLGDGRLLLDAGSTDGVRRDMAVLGDGGLVGRVVRVGRHRCWVETIILAGAAVATAGGADATPCMTVGTGGRVLRVEYVPRRAPLLRDTVLRTTGTDGIYPPGLPVARVSRIREGPGAFLQVEAVPMVDFTRLRTVVLVGGWNEPPQGEAAR